MKSIVFLGFLVMCPVVAVVGCGDDDDANGAGGAGGSGGAGSVTSTSSSKSASSSSGMGGTGGGVEPDGDDDAANANAFVLNMQADGALEPPGTDVDYYQFEGTAGQQILIATDSKPMGGPLDPTYVDLVVALFDANNNQIAQNDDPRPRFSQDSQLFTVLPAAGTYYVRVAECNAIFPGQCSPIADVKNTDYKVYIGGINEQILVTETPGAPTDVGAYTASESGGFNQKLFAGGFTADAETDVYAFTVPAIVPDPGNRPAFSFKFFPAGKDWSGASASIQLATIKDSTGAVVAQINPELSGLSPDDELDIMAPLTAETTYTLEVSHATGAVGANPFYYIFNFPDLGSNPVEGPDNDTTPEALTAVPRDGVVSYYVEGDLDDGDVDQFSFAIPAGDNQISATCAAWTSGSGLRGLTLSVRNSEGVEISGGSATETEKVFANVRVAPPADGTAVLHVSATSQDAVVTGKYYRCGVTVGTAAQ